MKNIKIIIAAEIVVLVIVGFVMLGLFLSSGGFFATTPPPTPQPVALPTATLPPTATPLAVAIPGKTGTEIVKQDDGTTKFIDYDALFEVTFPEGWLVVRPGSQEFQEALDNEAAHNEDLKNALESAKDFDPNIKRVLAYDTKPSAVKTGVLGYVVVEWDSAYERSIDDELRKSVADIEANPQNQGTLRVVSTDKIKVNDQIEVGRVGIKWNLTTKSGETVPMFLAINFFRTIKGMVLLTLTTPNELRPEVEPDFKAAVDTMRYLGR